MTRHARPGQRDLAGGLGTPTASRDAAARTEVPGSTSRGRTSPTAADGPVSPRGAVGTPDSYDGWLESELRLAHGDR